MSGWYQPYRRGTLLVPSGKDHLHIVCSDPVYHPIKGCDCVLIVNITSVPKISYFDNSCILDIGDHKFIRHKSYAYYELAVRWKVPVLTNKVISKEYVPHDDLTDSVMIRVMQGFSNSKHTSFEIKRFIKKNTLDISNDPFSGRPAAISRVTGDLF